MGNTYTTTLHCINSSIIKLSKLTKVAKVYRGVSGGVLPDACRVGNAYNVKGGVEGGFVSTTTDEKTAFFYAAGGADKSKRGGPAIVFETQMGMIDRGADVAWLSEFPHEAEILFAPLTGIEVRGSRVEGEVQVYEVALSINMTALTIEQVVSKRRKLVAEMCDQIVLGAPRAVQQGEWAALREAVDVIPGVVNALRAALVPMYTRQPEWYNTDQNFGGAVGQAVEVSGAVSGWGEGIAALASKLERDPTVANLLAMDVVDLHRKQLRTVEARGLGALVFWASRLSTLNLHGCNLDVEAGFAISLGLTATKTLTVLDLRDNKLGPRGAEALSVGVGANCSITSLDISWNRLGPSGLASFSQALETNKTLTHLNLSKNELCGLTTVRICFQLGESKRSQMSCPHSPQMSCTSQDMFGNSSSGTFIDTGLAAFSTAIATNQSLKAVVVAGNLLGPQGLRTIAPALKINTSITSLNLNDNKIASGGAVALSEVFAGGHSQIVALLLQDNRIGPNGIIDLAAALRESSVTTLNLQNNNLTGSDARDLAGVHAIAEMLAISRRVESLNLRANRLGVKGLEEIATMLRSNASLTELNLEDNEVCGLDQFGEGQYDVHGIALLAASVDAHSALKSLSLLGNRVEDDAKGILSKTARAQAKQVVIQFELSSGMRLLPRD